MRPIPLQAAGESAGTKASTLARLARTGLAVPPGMVVPAQISGTSLDHVTREIAAWAADSAPSGLVVRSSAPGEDGRSASFAGLFRSYFTGTAHHEIRAAIAAVRASLTALAVTSYSTRSGVPTPANMPVLVQAALRPYASGVAVAELARGRITTWRIEAVHGLAEPLMSGQSTGEAHHGDSAQGSASQPAHQRLVVVPGTSTELSTPPGEILTLHHPRLGPCSAKVAYSASSLVQYYRPPAWSLQPVLDETQRDSVVGLAARAAAVLHLDSIDIEWALLADGRLFLLQARHLTAPVPIAAGHTGNTGWHGLPASPGTAEGTAAPLGASLGPGSVLICQALTARTVTALLTRPAAIIAASGGTLSHTAILARELRIPCVANVTGAMTAIAPGQYLHVDGTAGTILPASPPEPAAASKNPDVTRADHSIAAGCVLTRTPYAATQPRQAVIVDADGARSAGDILTALRTHAQGHHVGVLVTDPRSTVPELPQGWQITEPDRLIRLIWPSTAGPVPSALTAQTPARGTSCNRPRPASPLVPGAFLPDNIASFAENTLGACSITATLSWPYHGAEVYEITDGSGTRYILKRHLDQLHFTRELTGYRWAAALAPKSAPRLVEASTALLTIVVTLKPGTPLTGMPAGAACEYDAYRQAGTLLRKFHATASGQPDPQVTGRILAKTDAALRQASSSLTRPERALIRRSATDLDRVTAELPAVATHGDYQPRNLLWNHTARELAVIDFDKAALAPTARDLAVITTGPLTARTDLRAAFYRGYGPEPNGPERALLTAYTVLNSLISYAWATANGDHEMTAEARNTFAQVRM